MQTPIVSSNKVNTADDESISMNEIVTSIKKAWFFIIKRWFVLVICIIIGAGIGFYKAWKTPVLFVAQTKFTLEENRAVASNMSAYSAAAGYSADASGGGNLLIGDNLLGLLSSRIVVKKTLLSPFDSTGKISIADKFIEVYKLKEAWKKSIPEIGTISFAPVAKVPDYDRTKSQVLQNIVNMVLGCLKVERQDKKMTFISLEVTMEDEMVAKAFAQALVAETSEFYKNFKTAKVRSNIAALEKRLDSIISRSDSKSYAIARQSSQMMDINPAFMEARVPAEFTNRDKSFLQASMQNTANSLEQQRVILSQEMPVLTLIDDVELPLGVTVPSKMKYIVFGGIGGVLFGILLILVRRLFANK